MKEHQTPPSPSADLARRRRVLKWIVIIAASLALLYALLSGVAWLLERWENRHSPSLPSEEIEFYPVDDNYDILTDPVYLEYDRRLHYYDPDSGASYSVDEEDIERMDAELRVFYRYFDAAIRGSEEELAACVTESYRASGKLPENFTMQMIYDIRIIPQITEEESTLAFRVEYKIRQNNGTFRNDMGSDVVRAQYITLVPDGYEYLIDNILLYTSHQ